jgi:hypothetical protein
MANALGRYDQLLNAMGEANADKNAKLAQIHSTKAGIDSTAKILGETKLALSGMSAQKTIGSKIIKPWLKKKYEEYKAKKEQSGGGDNEGGENVDPETGTGAAQNSNDLGGESEAPPAYTEDGNALTTSSVEDRISAAEGAEDDADEVGDILSKAGARLSKFESRVSSGQAEGEELTDEARQGGALAFENGAKDAPLTLEDWQATNATGFSKAKTSFRDSDLGENDTAGAPDQVYSRTNGMSADETETVNNYLNRSNLPNQTPKGTPPTEEEASASLAGQTSGSLEESESRMTGAVEKQAAKTAA